MDIAEVTRRTGLTNAALHHYEQLGLIAPTGRVGLRRQYDGSVVEVLAVILVCQRSGFTLAEIGEIISSANDGAWRDIAAAKLAQLEARIADLQRARDGLHHALECPNPNIMRCEHFRANLDDVLREHGAAE
jgi:DNA-binding transcriptional MerR regulator